MAHMNDLAYDIATWCRIYSSNPIWHMHYIFDIFIKIQNKLKIKNPKMKVILSKLGNNLDWILFQLGNLFEISKIYLNMQSNLKPTITY